MAEADLADEASNKTGWMDLTSAIVLSAAAALTTYASYQAELWDGEQAALYTEANALRTEASTRSLRAGQVQGTDLMAFGAWLNARVSNEPELEAFYVRRFRPEFARVFAEWAAAEPRTNPAAPPTPFAMPGYVVKELKEAEAMEQQAREVFERGQDANDKGDKFVLGTVILANAMFFGGINQVPHSIKVRKALLFISIAFCAVGLVHIVLLKPAP